MGFLAEFIGTPAYIYGLFIFLIIFAASSKALVGVFSANAIIIGLILSGFTVYYLYNQGFLTGEARVVIEPIETGWLSADISLLIATIAFVYGILSFLAAGYRKRHISGKVIAVSLIAGLVGCYFISPFFNPMSAGMLYAAVIVLLSFIMFSSRRF